MTVRRRQHPRPTGTTHARTHPLFPVPACARAHARAHVHVRMSHARAHAHGRMSHARVHAGSGSAAAPVVPGVPAAPGRGRHAALPLRRVRPRGRAGRRSSEGPRVVKCKVPWARGRGHSRGTWEHPCRVMGAPARRVCRCHGCADVVSARMGHATATVMRKSSHSCRLGRAAPRFGCCADLGVATIEAPFSASGYSKHGGGLRCVTAIEPMSCMYGTR